MFVLATEVIDKLRFKAGVVLGPGLEVGRPADRAESDTPPADFAVSMRSSSISLARSAATERAASGS